MKKNGERLIELIRSCRNKAQISQSVSMPQLKLNHEMLTKQVSLAGLVSLAIIVY